MNFKTQKNLFKTQNKKTMRKVKNWIDAEKEILQILEELSWEMETEHEGIPVLPLSARKKAMIEIARMITDNFQIKIKK